MWVREVNTPAFRHVLHEGCKGVKPRTDPGFSWIKGSRTSKVPRPLTSLQHNKQLKCGCWTRNMKVVCVHHRPATVSSWTVPGTSPPFTLEHIGLWQRCWVVLFYESEFLLFRFKFPRVFPECLKLSSFLKSAALIDDHREVLTETRSALRCRFKPLRTIVQHVLSSRTEQLTSKRSIA